MTNARRKALELAWVAIGGLLAALLLVVSFEHVAEGSARFDGERPSVSLVLRVDPPVRRLTMHEAHVSRRVYLLHEVLHRTIVRGEVYQLTNLWLAYHYNGSAVCAEISILDTSKGQWFDGKRLILTSHNDLFSEALDWFGWFPRRWQRNCTDIRGARR